MRPKVSGFTLVELMLALFISGILLSLFMEIYVHAMIDFRKEQATLQIQENARAAAQILRQDLSSAGYIGCAHLQDDIPVLSSAEYSLSIDDALRGKTPPALSKSIKPGTDVIEVKKMVPSSATLASKINHSKQFLVQGDLNVNPKDWMMISDCHHAAIVQVESVHGQAISITNVVHSEFDPGSFVGLFEDNIYYVSNTGRKDSSGQAIDGLYVLNADGVHQELLEGVDDLKIRYLILSGSRVEEVSSDSVSNWADVMGVEMTLGFRSVILVKNKPLQDSLTLVIALKQRLGS